MEEQNKQEVVGFHKGALVTLAKERQELARLLSIVDQLIAYHINALKQLGVDVEAMLKQAQEAQAQTQPQQEKTEAKNILEQELG